MLETKAIMQEIAEVETEHLFVKVAEKMKRFHTDIGSLDPTFQETPKVFQTVCVNLPINVLLRMVNNLMGVVGFKAIVGGQRIGVDSTASRNMVSDFPVQSFLAASWNYHSSDFPPALQDSEDGGFVVSASTSYAAAADESMHIPRLAADEGFIHFDVASVPADLHKRAGLHSKANPVEHEPSGFLGDTESAGHFVRTNSVLAVGYHPDRHKPFIQRQRRIFKDSPDLDAELPMVVDALALPLALIRQEAGVLPATNWASDPIGPTHLGDQAQAVIGIREVEDGLLECSWLSHGVPHTQNTTTSRLICQVYYCQDLTRESPGGP